MNCMISSVESGGPIKLPFYLFDVMWSSGITFHYLPKQKQAEIQI